MVILTVLRLTPPPPICTSQYQQLLQLLTSQMAQAPKSSATDSTQLAETPGLVLSAASSSFPDSSS